MAEWYQLAGSSSVPVQLIVWNNFLPNSLMACIKCDMSVICVCVFAAQPIAATTVVDHQTMSDHHQMSPSRLLVRIQVAQTSAVSLPEVVRPPDSPPIHLGCGTVPSEQEQERTLPPKSRTAANKTERFYPNEQPTSTLGCYGRIVRPITWQGSTTANGGSVPGGPSLWLLYQLCLAREVWTVFLTLTC